MPRQKLYWYFAPENRRLQYGDGREIVVGEAHKVEGVPVLCKHGLHASKNPLDALEYDGGPIVYRVRLSGEVVHGDDKSVANRREYVEGGVDVSAELDLFARKCALDVVHLWDAPDVVIRFLKTGDESLRDEAYRLASASAWAGAWASANASANASAWESAWVSASASAWAGAWASANASANASAWESAWASAWAECEAKANRRLTQLLCKAIRERG